MRSLPAPTSVGNVGLEALARRTDRDALQLHLLRTMVSRINNIGDRLRWTDARQLEGAERLQLLSAAADLAGVLCWGRTSYRPHFQKAAQRTMLQTEDAFAVGFAAAALALGTLPFPLSEADARFFDEGQRLASTLLVR